MNLCGSNIIPIFITIACCGVIFVYFNMRLAEVKHSVEKQNRVLTAFITNVQTDIRSGGSMMASSPDVGANHLASPEALKHCGVVDKIVVSDDEDDDEDDDDDESESDSESESEDEEDEGSSKRLVQVQVHDLSVQSIDLGLSVQDLSASVDPMILSFEVLPVLESTNKTESSISEITEDSLNLDTKKEEIDDEVSYDSMRVDDLRKIVSDKNLSTKEEVKKLKKPELLLLLKK